MSLIFIGEFNLRTNIRMEPMGFEPFARVGPVTLKDFSINNSDYFVFISAWVSRE